MIKKIRSNLSLKLFLLLSTLFFLVSIILYGILTAVIPKKYEETVHDKLTEDILHLRHELEECTIDEISNPIYNFCIKNNASVVLEYGDIQKIFGELNREKEMDIIKDSSLVSITTSFEQKLSGDENIYTLMVSVSQQNRYDIIQAFEDIFPIICCVTIVISAFIAWIISRSIALPIIKISKKSRQMTTLDLTGRCDVNRTDEIGILASNLDIMASRLEHTLKELTIANEKLQADMEQERHQEKQRMDFFRAVSHELKTPLTVLKGELEGMIYQVGEYKDRDTHLRKSVHTVNEMESLVKEIISASRMTGNDFILNIEDVEISQIVKECCRKWQGVAEDKEQNFCTEIASDIYCRGDRKLLKKAISNVIGNAVVHSQNYAEVVVYLSDNILQIRNSGVCIPPGDLEHIFEPFYRVEDSRSRETGGSGLGLYITKSILDRHGFRSNINNSMDGVCFIITFL